jgi:hypothetical protein
MIRSASTSSGPPCEQERGRAHAYAEDDEYEAKCERKGKIALAGFQGDGRRHSACETADITPDDDDCTNLRDCATERRKECGQESGPSHM